MKYITSNNKQLAYKFTEGEGTGVIYVGGHLSVTKGRRRSRVMSRYCAANNIPFLEFDWAGCGKSEGAEAEWTLERWFQNLIDIIDQVAPEKNILVGHSMGGYLMLLAAMARADKVSGLIGMSSGFGSYVQSTGKTIVEDAEKTVALNLEVRKYDGVEITGIKDSVDITQPVKLMHGMQDDVVSYYSSINMAEKIAHDNVELTLLKGSDHFVDSKKDTDTAGTLIQEMLDMVG